MTKDLRTLCEEAIQLWDADCDMEGVLSEMRDALAKSTPQEPTDKEICECYRQAYFAEPCRQGPIAQAAGLRAVLAKWGNR
jgi:ubiquitin-protein ligase